MKRPKLIQKQSFLDDRGYSFFDIYQQPTMTGQVNISTIFPDAVKAFHYHKLQDDYWFCVKGNMHAICATPKSDNLVNSNSIEDFYIDHFYFGEAKPALLWIPSLTWHGYRSLGNNESTLLYWVTNPYNPDSLDEYRKEWDIFGSNLWQSNNK